MDFKFSSHALEEMEKRKVPISFVEAVLENPQQTLQQDEEITIYQSQMDFGTGKLYLLRVFINTTIEPAIFITVYRTSQIKKYWRNP
ncbi:DUF4258 domain-containing protein [Trichothermofontia sichuanensis B231]|uniref:DUF4258 domain-containing protein n=1 Tax=Trichothermofontia sichuanensis TaxID=3045816 RepID=UPI0022481D9E|nr:DUF4258 domain-containing protein [Trichothermofontia sichuanensis]UZQ55801.1 DUF4258 domain-containing protein [Trichothermofontia sichuanensis B231]